MTVEKPNSHSVDVPNFYYTNRLPEYQHANIKIGDYTYGRPAIRFLTPDVTLTIGKFCSIAAGVTFFMGGNHRGDWVSTYPFPVLSSDWPNAKGKTPISKGDVTVGNDVWIGTDAMIMSGVRIGDGVIIGARAVITKDVAPYTIVAGNPAREVRQRFDDATVTRLLEIQWWHWEIEKIRAYAHMLCSENIEHFLTVYDQEIRKKVFV